MNRIIFRFAAAAALASAIPALANPPGYLWVPNGAEGTLSKLDATTGEEVARYASITRDPGRVVSHVVASLPAWGAAHKPEHVAVDFHGDGWVGNVAPGIQPSLTKFWRDVADCVDSNGNLQIDTSSDVNSTPGIQLDDPEEFLGEADECIAMTIIVGASSGEARALTIDRGLDEQSGGNAWIGIRNEQAYYQIDGDSGAILQRVPPTGASGNNPFTAAIDANGILWATHGCCSTPKLWRIDTETGAHQTVLLTNALSCHGSYEITIDLAGKVWLGGYPCTSAIRYDPSNSAWFLVDIPNHAGWNALGIGLDRRGNVWLSLSATNEGRVARVDTTAGVSTGAFDNGGVFPYAVAVGFDGDVWSINSFTNDVSRLHIDTATQEPAPHPTTGNVVDVFPVGNVAEAFGDFTGLALHTIVRPTVTEPLFHDGFESGDTLTWFSKEP